ncbi:MAG: 23S rRNA (adenine(1618)-N(6))-methyltransferase RlmF [Flavobacteriales bacterium]
MKDRITRTVQPKSSEKKSSGISKISRNESKRPQALKLEKGKTSKTFFHIRSKHRGQYDFPELINSHSVLEAHVRPNKYGTDSIDFSDPNAVKELNTALLKHHYNIDYWDIPAGYLCPPIPSRADYLHHVADLFEDFKPANKLKLKCLDIGAGANMIYPMIGVKEYGWSFLASEMDAVALQNMELLITKNPELEKKITVRKQETPSQIFEGILKKTEKIDAVVCNPPFHESASAAAKATERKFKNLGLSKDGKKAVLNFGGKPSELWTFGGEQFFISSMIAESANYAKNIMWFTTLVSKKESLIPLKKAMSKVAPTQVKTIRMNQGNKSGRILAWTFMDEEAQKIWAGKRFK